jgi:Holliday junction DNA helicase RuvA
MYAFISGVVDRINGDSVDLDCHGIGFEIFTNPASMQAMSSGKPAKLYVQLIVREDAHTLYGFLQAEDKQMFNRLLGVTGIGPKLALSVLSTMSASQVAISIVTSDEQALTCVPGLGKKMAQRLILELKSRLLSENIQIGVPAAIQGEDIIEDAIAILLAMGFSPQDSAAAVALVKAEGGNAETIAMSALRRLDRK